MWMKRPGGESTFWVGIMNARVHIAAEATATSLYFLKREKKKLMLQEMQWKRAFF